MASKDYHPIEPAKLTRGDGPIVKSSQFNDIYFSELGGLEETRHVFFDGNDLSHRIADLNQSVFCIGELGFGTGLNIMALMQLWDATASPDNHLHIWSVEGFPLSPEDFSTSADKIAEQWPSLKPYANRVKALYPPLTRNVHRLLLSKNVTLTLVFDDVKEALNQASGPIDAWFLDGFSPSQNPDMWRESTLKAIAEVSASNATFATFTVARLVRDGLTAAGFASKKRPGFGRKRDMLTGYLKEKGKTTRQYTVKKTIRIKGGGIAGASLAWHLNRNGTRCFIDDPAGLAAEASGNTAGLIMPRVDLDTTAAARFYRAAYFYALHILDEIDAVEKGIFKPCGVLQLSTTVETSQRAEQLAMAKLMPKDHLKLVTSTEAKHLAQVDLNLDPSHQHIWFPQAGMVNPVEYTKALGGKSLPTDSLAEADVTIHANSIEAAGLISPKNALSPNLGQIEHVTDATPPSCAITLGAYIGPAPTGGVVFGATYDRTAEATLRPTPTRERTAQNLAQLIKIIPWLTNLQLTQSTPRAAFRCVTPDKHPIAGELSADSFILSGLGSRGLVTAPLLAAMVTAQLTNTPTPTGLDIAVFLRASRFAERAAKRHP